MKTVPLALAVALAATAGQANAKQLCCGAKVAMTFGDAAPEVKLLTLVLWGASIAAVVLWGLALRRPTEAKTARTFAVLQPWRTGGPLLGAALASYLMVNFFVAVYAYAPVTRYQQYAPGFAEAAMVLWAGFQAGAFAALTAEHLKWRMRRDGAAA